MIAVRATCQRRCRRNSTRAIDGGPSTGRSRGQRAGHAARGLATGALRRERQRGAPRSSGSAKVHTPFRAGSCADVVDAILATLELEVDDLVLGESVSETEILVVAANGRTR